MGIPHVGRVRDDNPVFGARGAVGHGGVACLVSPYDLLRCCVDSRSHHQLDYPRANRHVPRSVGVLRLQQRRLPEIDRVDDFLDRKGFPLSSQLTWAGCGENSRQSQQRGKTDTCLRLHEIALQAGVAILDPVFYRCVYHRPGHHTHCHRPAQNPRSV